MALFDHITGYSATTESHDALGVFSKSGNTLSVEFTKVDEAASLNPQIWASTDLENWELVDEISEHVDVFLSGAPGLTTITIEADTSEIPRLFLRQSFEPSPAP